MLYNRELCMKFINQIESIHNESKINSFIIGGPEILVDSLFNQLSDYQIIQEKAAGNYYNIIGTNIDISKCGLNSHWFDALNSNSIHIFPISFLSEEEPEHIQFRILNKEN